MKLIKKINNNFALALDSKGDQIIVEGRGVGFIKMPCELSDLSVITRTYYDMDDSYIDAVANIPSDILDAANKIYIFFMTRTKSEVNPNLPFILADHINFAINRTKKGMLVEMPLYYELMEEYPLEYETAAYGLRILRHDLKIALPKNEIGGIMLNLINAQANSKKAKTGKPFEEIAEKITHIVEKELGVKVSYQSFNYARFVTNLGYLYKRLKEDKQILTTNNQMYEELIKQYPKTSACVDVIAEYIKAEEKISITREEKLYLILHVNRLCSREIEK